MVKEVLVMKWAVDRIIDNIAILENIETLEKKEVDLELLPYFIHEGSIIIIEGNKYYLDESLEERRRRIIEEKFRKLRNNT